MGLLRRPPLWKALVAALSLVVSLRSWIHAPPQDAAAGLKADTERHLVAIAATPRPLGSPEHERVKTYLASQIRAMGIQVDARARLVARRLPGGPLVAAQVENVVAVLPGREHTRALLVASHYDTVPNSPGAADDGAAVASMLATMRLLRAQAPLRNDVIFLFSDGEEAARLGAQAFADQDAQASRVAAVLNFEARGSRGMPILFETGADDGQVLRLFASAAQAPLATSVAGEVYRRMPNDTDFSVFRDRHIPGLNFASIDGFEHYHTVMDDLAHLDRSMVGAQGEHMVRMIRALGDSDLGAVRGAATGYFLVPGDLLVRYPLRASLGLAGIAALVVALALARAVARRVIRPRQVILSAAGTVVACCVLAVSASWLWRVLRPIEDFRPLPQNGGYRAELYLTGFVLLALAFTGGLAAALRGRLRGAEIQGGAALLSAALGTLAALTAPGATYLFALTAIAAALELHATNRSGKGAAGWPLIRGLATFTLVAITAPLLYLFSLALGPAGLPIVAAVALWIALLGFANESSWPEDHPGRAAAALAIGAVAVLVAARATDGFDAAHPRPASLVHLTNNTEGRSVWASPDPALGPYTRPVFGEEAARRTVSRYLPELSRAVWTRPAPYPAVPPVLVELAGADGSALSDPAIRVRTRGADVLDLRFAPSCRPTALEMAGLEVTLQAADSEWIQIWVPPAEGLALRGCGEGASIRFSAVAKTFDPAVQARLGAPDRPAGTMPLPFGFDTGDLTAVRWDFGP